MEEHIFIYIFRERMGCIDWNLNLVENIEEYKENDWNIREIKLLHYGGQELKNYINYNYNTELDFRYYAFWEYFSQTPFYKNNYVEYSNIHMAHLRRWLLQEREERKWHIEDSRRYSKDNYNKLLNMILWFIPFKSIRNKLRNKYIVN